MRIVAFLFVALGLLNAKEVRAVADKVQPKVDFVRSLVDDGATDAPSGGVTYTETMDSTEAASGMATGAPSDGASEGEEGEGILETIWTAITKSKCGGPGCLRG